MLSPVRTATSEAMRFAETPSSSVARHTIQPSKCIDNCSRTSRRLQRLGPQSFATSRQSTSSQAISCPLRTKFQVNLPKFAAREPLEQARLVTQATDTVGSSLIEALWHLTTMRHSRNEVLWERWNYWLVAREIGPSMCEYCLDAWREA